MLVPRGQAETIAHEPAAPRPFAGGAGALGAGRRGGEAAQAPRRLDAPRNPPKRKEEAPVGAKPPAALRSRRLSRRSRPPPHRAAPPARSTGARARSSRAAALEVDARLDLHGLTQRAAHQRLGRFLAEAQANGARLVLVITGKGRPAEPAEGHGEARGVLRRAVPDWLQSPEFRPFVAGFDEAGRRHGGAGALYVRIRRKRRPAP